MLQEVRPWRLPVSKPFLVSARRHGCCRPNDTAAADVTSTIGRGSLDLIVVLSPPLGAFAGSDLSRARTRRTVWWRERVAHGSPPTDPMVAARRISLKDRTSPQMSDGRGI